MDLVGPVAFTGMGNDTDMRVGAHVEGQAVTATAAVISLCVPGKWER